MLSEILSAGKESLPSEKQTSVLVFFQQNSVVSVPETSDNLQRISLERGDVSL